MQTQKVLILNYMKNVGGITPKEAEDKFSCMRLASRISDLRREGHPIKKTMVDGINQFGKKCRFARYELLKEVTADE